MTNVKIRGLDDVMSDFEQMRDSDHYFRLFLAYNPASGELYSMLLRPVRITEPAGRVQHQTLDGAGDDPRPGD